MSATVEKRQHAVKSPRLRSAAGEAFNDLLGAVLHLHGSFTKAGEALTKPAGQTLARWLVLDQCRDTPSSVSDVARRLRLARQSVQRVADLLVDDGLCSYEDNPRHQRAKLLELTETGWAKLFAIDSAQRQWCDVLGQRLGETTLRRTTSTLRSVIEAVESVDPV